MTLGANQIAAHAAALLDLEEQIEALQTGKRDAYKALRDEHGKAEANALKQAVKLSRMDSGKRDEAAAVDTEAMRMLAIIERAARAPRATPAIAKTVPDHDAETGEIIEINSVTQAAGTAGEGSDALPADTKSTAARMDVHEGKSVTEISPAPLTQQGFATPDSLGDEVGRPQSATLQSETSAPVVPWRADTSHPAGTQAPPVDPPTGAAVILARRPWCLHAHNTNKCGGYGKQHCGPCLKAHADDVGETA